MCIGVHIDVAPQAATRRSFVESAALDVGSAKRYFCLAPGRLGAGLAVFFFAK
jgi:hypothetical protein